MGIGPNVEMAMKKRISTNVAYILGAVVFVAVSFLVRSFLHH